MKIATFTHIPSFGDKIETKVVIESAFSKEIRIVLKSGLVMKEHKTKYPIVVHVLEGQIEFGVEQEVYMLDQGSVIALDGNIPHNLRAIKDSVVRLTLSKFDHADRVENVIADSNA